MSEPPPLTVVDIGQIERRALDYVADTVESSTASDLVAQIPRLVHYLRETLEEYDELEKLFDRIHAADIRGIVLWRERSPTERELLQPDRAKLVLWLLEERDRLLAMLPESSR